MAKARRKPTEPKRPYYDEPGYNVRNPYLGRVKRQYPERVIDPSEAVARKGEWAKWSDGKPIHIEIGPGKGRFITDYALAHPEAAVIAIEIKFRRMYKVAKRLTENGAYNAFILRYDGNFLDRIFGPGELERAYLQFPDPWWRKERQRFRHIITADFLCAMNKMLAEKGEFIIKTDHRPRFELIRDQVKGSPLHLAEHSTDFESSPYTDGNIQTIFEEKFCERGMPICYLKSVKV